MNLDELFPHERAELLEALRRDLREQDKMAKSSSSRWKDWHRNNVIMVKRLLDALNPKACTASNGRMSTGPLPRAEKRQVEMEKP